VLVGALHGSDAPRGPQAYRPGVVQRKQRVGARRLHVRRPPTGPLPNNPTIQRQIDATDRRIDRLVCELYDLTDDEIAIVEEVTAL